MSTKYFKQNEPNIDRMEHYKSILSKLLSKKDDTGEPSSTKTQNKDKGHALDGSSPLFVEQINDIPKNDQKRLKHTLNEISTFLNAEVDEVDRDIQAMVESGELRQDNVNKLSAALLGKLGKMAENVDDLLNTAASRCRPMTTEEKIELGKCIRKLPEQALDRVVDIVTAGKPESQSSEKINVNLGELDDAILWRLYYHVKYVLKESNL